MPAALRLLYAEDDPLFFRVFSDRVRGGFPHARLDRAENLAEAVVRVSERTYDLVFSDLSMPDSDGLEAVRVLRKAAPDAPVVVVTAHDDETLERDAIAAGAQDYLVKGTLRPDTLARTVRHAIARHGLVSEVDRLARAVAASNRKLKSQEKQLRRKNRRLRRLYKSANRFVDNVSHEFRTPLAVIKDYVSLVQDGVAGPVSDEQRELLEVANVRTDELNNMVDDMLDVSRIEAGLLGAYRRPCRFSDVAATVCPALARRAAVRGIDFRVDLGGDNPELYCDAEKVGRVVINLLTNAMKFCGDPGRVVLTAVTDEVARELRVGVADDGAGMDEEAVGQIFERFKQLKNGRQSSTKGFGLGLNIVRELVDLNFGDLTVASTPGEGAEFAFTVPLNDPRAVVERYVGQRQEARQAVTVARVTPVGTTGEGDLEDVDAFLHCELRRDDLLFRLGTAEWAVVAAAGDDEWRRLLDRVVRDHAEACRNRPRGPLPALEWKQLGRFEGRELDEVADLVACLAPARAEFPSRTPPIPDPHAARAHV